ncbi:hypothetical protein [Glycomyces algeriensis]|uniref:Uncharacterized protein n=1 Tax=Glycomyces algeriensis TaxID=256037 RepID=A0A9W6G4H5_9ACTN|nr:hypothetical protein [Glycomyces algeriensis]MDA1368013.1 hypothetical protein [Glycomyces algeriensis]MDR7352521.1 hypothetical protein [Glycomyces algeriensis]GLI40203.1 hypothetical protein GALLR39Z86_00530 [Glycomyces algeriensis]
MPSELPQDQLDKLIALASFGGSASNSELWQRYRFRLVSKPRTALELGGYISSSRKSGNAPFDLLLTEKGRELCREALRTGPDSSASLGHRINQGMFERLAELLAANGLDVFDLVKSQAEPEAASKEGLSAAYFALAPRPGAWVSLADLRPELEGVERESLDRLIHDLHVAGDVTLIPEENRRSITPEDREAAIRIGGEDRHLISIGRPL